MTPCPSDEQLTGLLADTLSTAEQALLAQHVEGCISCQEKLARLTQAPDAAMWRRAEQMPPGPEVEEWVVRRLKRMRPSTPAGLEQAARPAGADPDWPDVPGYEVVGELGRGGMGVVYQARQVALDRTVALNMVLS